MSAYLMCAYGSLVVMCALAGLFFLRYWRLTRDGFFIWFAAAFWTFAISWGLLAYDFGDSERAPYIYLVRLVGFVEIIGAIAMKNRAES